MNKSGRVAAVTGASGTVGRRIVEQLLFKGYQVRVLSRRAVYPIDTVEHVRAGLEDDADLERLIAGADLVFHGAAELKDENCMQAVNVDGTARLLAIAKTARVGYFCFISSAGVVGLADTRQVDEKTPCLPRNMYEKSKYQAETVVFRNSGDMPTVILRPTNVVDEYNVGVCEVLKQNSLKNRLKLRLIGKELSHIVHAENVAAAALHFRARDMAGTECYFVSCDDEQAATYAELYAEFSRCTGCTPKAAFSSSLYMPIAVPRLLRKLAGRPANSGAVRYSSGKLISTGFRFPVSVLGTVSRLAASGSMR